MATIAETIPATTQMQSALGAGLETISLDQVIDFEPYVKLVLPIDGFVFWVKAGLLSKAALFNIMKFNQVTLNQAPGASAAQPFSAKGSLHYASNTNQNEDETFAVNSVIFTSEVEIQDLNQVSPDLIYLGTIDNIRFAFSQRRSFYRQAGIYHYTGDAIYPAFESQIIDTVAGFAGSALVVSNSLPIWLGLNGLNPWMEPFYPLDNDTYIPIYPSYLVPDNISPPYISVHIDPANTNAIQSAPYLDSLNSHWQLAQDKVRLTMYGLRNNEALDFVDYVFQYSMDTDTMGIMNMPIVRDEKRTQDELPMLAMKKTVEFDVSYYQARIRNVAQKYILSCIPTFTVAEL